MSYASAVKDHGPPQKDEDKVPNAVPEIAHSDSGVHSIDSLSSDTVNIPSYADQQKAKEDADRAEEELKQNIDAAGKEAQEYGRKAEKDLERLEAQAGKKYQEWSQEAKDNYQRMTREAKENYDKVSKEAKENYNQVAGEAKKQYGEFKKEAGIKKEEAKESAKEAEEWAEKNKGNPVVIGNVVVIGALAALLGTGAYRMNKAGTLTWKVAGAWAGIVGLFAVGDYYISQYFFKKYPPKQ